MKTYVKPVAEIREFEVTSKIASLDSWLQENSQEVLGATINREAISSYYMAS